MAAASPSSYPSSPHYRSWKAPKEGLDSPNVRSLRGIRFLDLSFNKLGDMTCADVLRAAGCGPLEGLDLAGNHVHKGHVFVDVFAKTVAIAAHSHLRHIGG